MFKANLIIAIRSLLKRKVSSFINVIGLTVGMSVAVLIGLWIWDEVSYNKYHEKYDRIGAVLQTQTFGDDVRTWWGQVLHLADYLRDNYSSNFEQVVLADWEGDRLFSNGSTTLEETGLFIEPHGPSMLTLQMVDGTVEGLNSPNSVLISETMAQAFFGKSEVAGQTLTMNETTELSVEGVYKDLPQNAYFANAAFFASWQVREAELPEWLTRPSNWSSNGFNIFVEIPKGLSFEQINANIKDAKLKGIIAAGDNDDRFNPITFIHPMANWHLYNEFENGVNAGGLIENVWLFGIIGIFVLLLACINFMNLSTARSEKRAKEVGIRKVSGSSRRQLIGQFYGESLLVTVVAFIFALGLVQLCLPLFNQIADKEMIFPLNNVWFWVLGAAFSLLTAFLAGSYPAFYLSSFQPVKALKGTFQQGRLAHVPRKVLVVLQFTVSIILIIGTLVVFQQIQHTKNRSIGYQQDRLVNIPIKDGRFNSHYDAFKNELLQSRKVQEVTLASSPITQTWSTSSGFTWEGKAPEDGDVFTTLRVTPDFGQTVGWQVLEGRDFSSDLSTDSTAFVINEAAVKYLGFEDPIGKTINWGGDDLYKIIGVVGDMVMQNPYEEVGQMIFVLSSGSDSDNIIAKLTPGVATKEALQTLENLYKKYDPINPFEYEFVDQDYATKFGDEERIGNLAGIFTLLAIFISCLGLFGMISFVIQQRTKEIGIRKILGASVKTIVGLLSKDFIQLVLLAVLLSVPIAWYFSERWLENYVYRIQMEWWIFAVAGALALGIAFLTVSLQSISAALANPIEALRDE
ncbi:MAG: ABC transporter permease [Saprospiraceae bacterium]|nr:ABC transporter permease [Saprospiraceae bacterium]